MAKGFAGAFFITVICFSSNFGKLVQGVLGLIAAVFGTKPSDLFMNTPVYIYFFRLIYIISPKHHVVNNINACYQSINIKL